MDWGADPCQPPVAAHAKTLGDRVRTGQDGAMRIRVFVLACLALLAALPLSAQTFRVLETMPASGAVISGISSEYYVRFNRPVDHLQSFFIIKAQGGAVVERLALRYKTEPDVLFARAPTLAPGSYAMVWSLRLMDGAQVEEGEVAFSVKSR